MLNTKDALLSEVAHIFITKVRRTLAENEIKQMCINL